jgi:hypothetical protein
VGLILNRITTRRTLKVSLFILILSPSVVLEATTTQVDLRASSLAVAALVLLGSKSEILQPFSILTLGLAAGMKVPSIFSIIPFILIIPSYRNNLLKLKIIPSTILGLIATFVNLPWLIRNYSGYGSFFGEANVNRLQPGWAILKLAINPALFVERLLGILFSNIGLPIFTSINTHLFSFLKSISHSLRNLSHLPVSQYWPDITTAGFGINEDVAPNLVFVVFFISLVAYFLYKKRMKMALQLLLPLLFFVFFIEWQIWINRLLISTIVTVALVSVYVLNKESKGFPENLLKIFALCSIVVSTLFLLVSNDRGLLRVPMVPFGSNQDYFRQKPYLFESYSSLSNDLKTLKIKRVNLVSSTDSWEYPLWAMNPGVKFESFKGGKTPTLCLDTCTIRKDDSSYVPFDFGNAVELFVPRRSS